MEAFWKKIILDLGMPRFSRLHPPWVNLCWIDLDFSVPPSKVASWQSWKNSDNRNPSQQNPFYDQMGHTVET